MEETTIQHERLKGFYSRFRNAILGIVGIMAFTAGSPIAGFAPVAVAGGVVAGAQKSITESKT